MIGLLGKGGGSKVDVRTGSPDPDKPSRALPAAGDSETEILDIEQPPKCDGRTGAVGKVEPATGWIPRCSVLDRRPRHSPWHRNARGN